jgi:polygalacturonase
MQVQSTGDESQNASPRREFVKYFVGGALASPLLSYAEPMPASGASETPATQKHIFDVTEFGAVCDGKNLCTAAIQRAVDACGQRGGGRVLVPPGTYLTGPIFLKSNMELEICAGATLVGSRNLDEYPSIQGRWEGIDRTIYASLLTGEDLENVTITGRGVIDGSGPVWWEAAWKTEALRNKLGLMEREPENPPGSPLKWPRPRIINLYRCRNVRITGLTLLNSPSWTVHPVRCEDVAIDQLTILTPDRTPNTDGIDPDSCSNVRISNCYISTGDDGIVIKSGYKNTPGKPSFPSKNIVITNCVLGHGWAGIAIGSETAGGVRDVTISNCICEGARRGVNLKTARGRGNIVENIRVTNFVARNVDTGILISMFYDPEEKNRPPVPKSEATPTFRNLHFANISVNQAKAAVIIEGLPENPIENLRLASLHAEEVEDGLKCTNTRQLLLEGVIVNAARGAALQLIAARDCEVIRCGTMTPNSTHADVELERVENVVIQSCSTSHTSRALVELKGPESSVVTLVLNRVPSSVQEVVLSGGASEANIKRRM